MAERLRDWTDDLAFCSHCKAVFQSLDDAERHELTCKPPRQMYNPATGKWYPVQKDTKGTPGDPT